MNFASYRDELMEIYRQTPSKFHIFVSIWVIASRGRKELVRQTVSSPSVIAIRERKSNNNLFSVLNLSTFAGRG